MFINRFSPHAADRVTQVQSALGTGAAQTVVQTFTPNGQQVSLSDGRGNLTAYVYDGFDRLSTTLFPSPTTPGQVAGNSDFESLAYDANSNIVQRRLRDGKLISYALDRVTFKNVPGDVIYEYDTYYTYDLLGRLTRAEDVNTHYAAITYDGLGRQMSEASNFSTRTFAYDAAGRRTSLNYGDGVFTTYEYLVTGETSAILENGGAALGTYAYDDLGRRTSLTRGNGTVTTYAYDPASRLTTLGHDFAGTAQDVTSSFTYTAASQIGSRTRSNDLYAWTAATAVNRAYTNNGLNQHTTSGSTALSYDGRGNLTNSGSEAYAYSAENRLARAPGMNFGYDPLGRMHYSVAPSGGPTLQYDGDRLIREQDGAGNTVRRHVHGPGSDEPLLTYEGAGLSDKRYLHADERGSIIAISNASGQVTQINAYDDYGIPQGKNASGAPYSGGTATTSFGRFGYTGQAWLPEIGLYHYKARAYSPTLGRFMQTDPIGYGDGVNLYAYVGGDPVNGSDPSGFRSEPVNRTIRLYDNVPSSSDPRAGTGTNIGGASCGSCSISTSFGPAAGNGRPSEGGGTVIGTRFTICFANSCSSTFTPVLFKPSSGGTLGSGLGFNIVGVGREIDDGESLEGELVVTANVAPVVAGVTGVGLGMIIGAAVQTVREVSDDKPGVSGANIFAGAISGGCTAAFALIPAAKLLSTLGGAVFCSEGGSRVIDLNNKINRR